MTNPASHRSRRRRLAAASAAALVLFVPAAGSASIGAGIGANPIRLAGRAEPGGRYHLPSLYVVNTGTKAAEYRVRIERLGDAPGRDVPASWVRFARTRLRLRPHRSAIVPVTLVLPTRAAHGSYRSNVVVGTWTKRRGRGAALGAAAADELSFTVGRPQGFAWWSPRLAYPLTGIAAAILLFLLVRRAGIRVNIERRDA
jgi:hypothetical protein